MKTSTILFTGLPCSGKTSISDELAKRLDNLKIQMLDGDVIRKDLWTDLRFTHSDRIENLRRVSYISKMLNKNGIWVFASFIAPYYEIRNMMNDIIDNLIIVHVKCSAKECARRDVKGMWAMAKEGKIIGFTGYDAPYEEPLNADIVVDTESLSIDACINIILQSLNDKGLKI